MTATSEQVKSGEELDVEERERLAWAAYGQAKPGRERQRRFKRALALTEELAAIAARRERAARGERRAA